MTIRSVSRILNYVKTMEGEGFVVNRSLPNNVEFDPFLLLDEFGPVDLAPRQVGGVPAHPHRGLNGKIHARWKVRTQGLERPLGQAQPRRRSMDDFRRRHSTLREARKGLRAGVGGCMAFSCGLTFQSAIKG
jgi:hypothetical protein